MSGVVDVGDAVELTFTTAPGAEVEVTWLDPDLTPVLDAVPAAETPAGSGSYPYTFLPTRAGVWTAQFRSSGTATQFEQYWIRATAVTGLPPLAVLGDVAAQFGTMTTAQEGIAKWLLRAASKMVRARFPGLDAQIQAQTVDAEVAALGIVNMVLRVLRNPRGLRAESTGPFSRTYDTRTAAGLLVIAEEDAQLFVPPPAEPVAGVYAVGTARIRPGMVPPPSRCHW